MLVDWRCNGALVAANIAGRIRVISVDVCGFVLDAFGLLRAAIVGAFVPVVCVVLAPVAVGVLVDWRCNGALVAANIAGRIRVIGVDVRSLVLDALVPIRAAIVGAFVPVTRAVLDPITVAVLVRGRCDGALVTANIADRIRIIVIAVCFRCTALVRRGAIFICADTVVAGFTIGDPVAVGVLVDWRLGFVYRNRQLLRIAAHAVFRLNCEFGGAIRSGCAADLAGVLIQAQTGRQAAVFNAPYDGRSTVGGQGLAVRHVHLAARQGGRGDGGRKLCRQRIHRRRYAVAGGVKLPVVAQPLEIVFRIVLRFSYTIQHRRGECLPVLYDDLYLRLTVHSSTVQLQRHLFQAVLPQRLGVYHLQHRAIVVKCMGAHAFAKSAHAITVGSPQRIQEPILLLAPVPPSEASFDIGLILVQYSVPLVVPSGSVSSRGDPHGIAHAVALIRLAEDQPLTVQGMPRHTPPCDALRHKQRVGIIAAVLFVLTVLYCPVRAHRARVGKCLIVRSAHRGQVEIVRPARLQ